MCIRCHAPGLTRPSDTGPRLPCNPREAAMPGRKSQCHRLRHGRQVAAQISASPAWLPRRDGFFRAEGSGVIACKEEQMLSRSLTSALPSNVFRPRQKTEIARHQRHQSAALVPALIVALTREDRSSASLRIAWTWRGGVSLRKEQLASEAIGPARAGPLSGRHTSAALGV